VLGGSRELFERHVEAPAVLSAGEQQAASPSAGPRPSTSSPSLAGTVVNAAGKVVSNATVTLLHVETNAELTTHSNESGHYAFARLPPGDYLLGVTSAGLEPFHGRVTIPVDHAVNMGLQPMPVEIGMTIGRGFPAPRQGPAAPMPPTWSCVDRPMGRECGPPSLLQELERDRQDQDATRKSLATRPAWPVKSAPPHYPQELWDAMIEGSVVIEGRIGEDGVPTALEVTAPVHPEFAKAALESVSQWRFEPARQDGYPGSVPLKVTINFRLSGARARLPGAE